MALSRCLHRSNHYIRQLNAISTKYPFTQLTNRGLHLCSTRCTAQESEVKIKKSVIDPTAYGSPQDLYEARIKAKELRRDAHQVSIIEKLQDLHTKCLDYEPKGKDQGIFSKLFGGGNDKEVTSPQGLYLYGSVGCGKTMLMDLFYHTVPIEKKLRTHFHEFMLDVHRRIHAQKEKVPRQYNMVKTQAFDPIPPIAQSIAEENWLLCFDEFQVTDIADAMILKRLFDYLWRNGVVIIATSNRHPDDLYKNGLQRIHFLPFIPMVKERCKALSLDSGIDYRMMAMPADGKVYFVIPEDGMNESKSSLDQIFADLAANERKEIGPRTMTVLGRNVHFKKTCGRVLDIDFPDLCMKPLGAVDYLQICKDCDTVILRDIPRMNMDRKTEARRFITFIDTMYDNRVRLVCSAEAPCKWLFVTDSDSEYQKHFARVLIGDLDIQVGDDNESASIFTGEEEKFAFERVISRLTEMQTEDYWNEREELIEKRHKEQAKRKAKAAARAEKEASQGKKS